MDDELSRRITEARRRALPVPWMPPFAATAQTLELGPDLVHQSLIAEAVARQLRPCQRVLDGAGLRGLAFEVQRVANLVEAAGAIAAQVA